MIQYLGISFSKHGLQRGEKDDWRVRQCCWIMRGRNVDVDVSKEPENHITTNSHQYLSLDIQGWSDVQLKKNL